MAAAVAAKNANAAVPTITIDGKEPAADKVEGKEENKVVEMDIEELRKKFVGEVDLPESEEPLLKVTKSRFVLFPIKYREVSPRSFVFGVMSGC